MSSSVINRPVRTPPVTKVVPGRAKFRDNGVAHDDIVDRLTARMMELKDVVERTEFFRVLTDPAVDVEFQKVVMKEIYLEIFFYQPHVIEATMAIISKFPKADAKTIRAMMLHQCDESDHGEMALRDYVALGGDEAWARTRRISPTAFSVASLWWGLYHMEDPVAYLGALYCFEGLTPMICGPVVKALFDRGFPQEALEFITFHATEDIKHTNLVKAMIKDVAARYPDSEAAMMAGLDYFLSVYPIPGWDAAYERAKAAWIAAGKPLPGA